MEKKYIGKKCPYCKTAFRRDDVVAFCSICEMPHHLSCWQANEGCTTFGCTGTIESIINNNNSSVQREEPEQKQNVLVNRESQIKQSQYQQPQYQQQRMQAQQVQQTQQAHQTYQTHQTQQTQQTQQSQQSQQTVSREQSLQDVSMLLKGNIEMFQEQQGSKGRGYRGNYSQNTSLQPHPIQREVKQEQKAANPQPKFSVILEKELGKIQKQIGIMIEKTTLLKDNQNNTIYLRCNFRSLTDKTISGLLIDVRSFDVWGKELEQVTDFQMMELRTKRDSVFGQTIPIPIPNADTKRAEVVIKKVLYDDDSIFECSNEYIEFPKITTVEEFFGVKEYAEQYRREYGENAVYVPIAIDGFWRCTCGAINDNSNGRCLKCQNEFNKLLTLLDVEQIKYKYNTYYQEYKKAEEQRLINEQIQREKEQEQKEKEQKEREQRQLEQREREIKENEQRQREQKERELIEREARVREMEANASDKLKKIESELLFLEHEKNNKKRKKHSVFAIRPLFLLLLIALMVYLIGWYLIPFVKYKIAENDFNEGKYAEAAVKFEELGDFWDSEEKSKNCKNEDNYLKAIDLFDAKKYEEAIALFAELGDYSETKSYYAKANYEYAVECEKNSEYSKASELFFNAGDYSDSKARGEETAYKAAEKVISDGEYEKAAELYLASGNIYEDGSKKAKNAMYIYAGKLMEKGEYKNAAEAFGCDLLKGYKDSRNMKREAYYQYAKKCYDDKNYEEAALILEDMIGYKEADSLYYSAVNISKKSQEN